MISIEVKYNSKDTFVLMQFICKKLYKINSILVRVVQTFFTLAMLYLSVLCIESKLIFSIVIIVLFLLYLLVWNIFTIKNYFYSKRHNILHENMKITFDEDYFTKRSTSENKSYYYKFRYSKLEKIYDEKDNLFIQLNSSTDFILIPKRELGEGDYDRLVNHLKSKINNNLTYEEKLKIGTNNTSENLNFQVTSKLDLADIVQMLTVIRKKQFVAIRVFFIFTMAILLISLTMDLRDCFLGDFSQVPFIIFCFICVIVFLVVAINFNKIQMKIISKNYFNGNKEILTVSKMDFYDTYYSIEQDEVHGSAYVTIGYEDIKFFVVDKNLIVFGDKSKASSVICIKKNAEFEVGKVEEFIKFLSNKVNR